MFDARGVDGAVNGVATLFRSAGGGLRRLQAGLVRLYALAVIGGAAALLVYVGLRAA
ncbi:MAG: hypothetical protein M5U14_15295 [Acidimicrobiia bacterium]|nr:hypothetical protein [Acidimicrobiia bacterium]